MGNAWPGGSRIQLLKVEARSREIGGRAGSQRPRQKEGERVAGAGGGEGEGKDAQSERLWGEGVGLGRSGAARAAGVLLEWGGRRRQDPPP